VGALSGLLDDLVDDAQIVCSPAVTFIATAAA